MVRPLVASLALLGLPFWFPVDTALAEDESRQITVQLQAVADDSAEPQVAMVKVLAGEPGKVVVVSPEDSGTPRAWLGVMFDEVPEALAAQLELAEEQGLLIANVAKDSPADAAGFQVHDVVLSVKGVVVNSNEHQAAERISGLSPGDVVDIVLLQQGQKKNLKVKLGTRPAMDAMVWKFEGRPLSDVSERIRTRGKIMGRDPSGKWFVHDLGDVSKLPEHLKGVIPGPENRSMRVLVGENQNIVLNKVEDDGSAISINQKDGGPITVERTDTNGKKTTATYADRDELKQADPEAFALFADVGQCDLQVQLGKDGFWTFDVEKFHDGMGQWSEEIQGQLDDARAALERAREELEQNYSKIVEGWHGAAPAFRMFGDAGAPHAMMRMGKATQSFNVGTDGKIEVRIRKGDTEVVRNFSSERDLQQKDAELYAKYKEALEPEDE